MMGGADTVQLERRLYKRFESDQPVTFIKSGGESLPARAANISLAGIQVHCDRWTITQLSPGLERIASGQPVELIVKFELPAQGKRPAIPVQATCKAVALRRLSEDEYQLSLTYTFFEGTGYHDLEKFIDFHSP